MVKAIYFFKRRPGMSVEAFQEHWRSRHAELVTRIPEVRRYVQCHTLPSGYRKGEPAYDGVAELWFDDTDAMRRIAELPESRAVLADAGNFLDTSKPGFVITEERVMKEGPRDSSMVKMVEGLVRTPAMDAAAFHEYWLAVHGPLAAKVRAVRRYVQCHTRRAAYLAGRQPLFDGVAEVWADSIEALRESAATPEYAAVTADEPNFLDRSRLALVLAQEHEILR